MLINLSNHPSAEWGEYQKNEVSKRFGEIIDIQLPIVPPEANEEDILEIAKKYKDKIDYVFSNIELKGKNENGVNLMGEMTFYFARMFLKYNNNFYASTTPVDEEVNKKRQKEFKFIKFRKYFSLNSHSQK
jgi:hypothetical protein